MTAPILPEYTLVAGAGVSGLGAAQLLQRAGARFTVVDDSAERRGRAAANGYDTCTGDEARARFGQVGLVVTSPGWRPDAPLLVDAMAAGIEVIGDVELCFRLDRAAVFGPPRTWLVVTGTNGKTTTTGMLAQMMLEASEDTGLRAGACGNIGVAVGEAMLSPERLDVLVAELSSFQLHWSSALMPDAGVLLNLADDHIDWHGSFAEYAAAKAKVLKASVAVVGIDDAEVARLATETGRTDIIGFTLSEPENGQVGVSDGRIVAKLDGTTVNIASADGIEPAGAAGVLDALAATAVALTQGATPEHIQRALDAYQVEGHRGSVVHSAWGVDWVDNSKATNPHAADSALTGAGPVVWVAGGQLKGASVDDVVKDHAGQLRAVALLGSDRELIRAAVEQYAPGVPVFVSDASDPDKAMDEVVAWAATQARSGDTVLLAPAAASLDMFSGMSARGDAFAAAAMRHWNPGNE